MTTKKHAHWADSHSHFLASTNETKPSSDHQQKQDDVLAHAIQILKDTTKLGYDAWNKLENQNQQLKRIDGKFNHIDESNKKNKRYLRSIRSVFGGLLNKITSYFPAKKSKDAWDERYKQNTHHYSNHPSSSKPKTTAVKPVEKMIGPSTPLYQLYKRNEFQLNEINDLTLGLQDLAYKINGELSFQNDRLDALLEKANKALQEVRTNKEKALDLLK